MAVEASSLIARVSGDTSQAQGDLRRFGDAVNEAGADAVQSAARVERLSTSIGLQERQLQLLKERQDENLASKSIFDSATQQLQLRIDRLTASMTSNATSLEIEKQHLQELTQSAKPAEDAVEKLATSTDDAGKTFDLLGTIVTGAARQLGALGINAVVVGFRELVNVGKEYVQTGVESYGTNERITQSYQALVAVEIQHANSTLTQAQALQQASGPAQELLKWNQQLAINSPFSEESAAKATQLALAYGFTRDQAQHLTQTLADTIAATGGSGDVLERVAHSMGQIEANGKTSARELNELANAGINARQILADAFHTSTANIEKMNEAGQLTADKVIPAIEQALDQRFGGAAKRQAGTIQGLGNSLQDLYAIAARDVLGPAIEAAIPFVKQLTDYLQDPATKESLKAIGVEVGTLAREGLPQLVQAGRDVLGAIKPTIEFVQTAGIPIVEGLAVAYAVQLTPAILASIPAFQAQAVATFAANAPLVIIAGSIAAVGVALNRLESDIDTSNDKLLNNQVAYAASGKSLESYGKLTDEAQQKLKPLHDAMEHERDIIKEQTELRAKLGTFGQYHQDTKAQIDALDASYRGHLSTLGHLNEEYDGTNQNLTSVANASTITEDRLSRQAVVTDHLAKKTKELTDTEREHLEQQLQQQTQKVGDTTQKLDDGAEAYNQAQATRLTDHRAKLAQIETQADTDRLAALQTLHTAEQTADKAYFDATDAAHTAFVQKRQEADYADGQRHIASEKQLHDALDGITQKSNEQIEQYNHEREQKEQDFQQRLGDLQRTEGERQAADALQLTQKLGEIETQRTAVLTQANADRLAVNTAYQTAQSNLTDAYNAKEIEADYKLNEQRQSAQHSYQDKIRDFNQQALDAADSYTDARTARETDLANKIADIQSGLQDKLADIQSSLQDKVGDLRLTASIKVEDSTTDFNDNKQDRAEAHNDKLLDLQKQFAQAHGSIEELRIQSEITAENERYDEVEKRAERDFQRKQERADRDLKLAEDRANREATQATERANREATQSEQQATTARNRAQQAADGQYNDTLAALARKRGVIESDYQYAITQINEQGEHERTARATTYQNALTDLATKHTNELAAITTKENTELGKLNEHAQKERDDYATREKDAKTHYDQALKDLRDANIRTLGELDYKFGEEKKKIDQSVRDAKSAFDDRERLATQSYNHDLETQTTALNTQRQTALDKLNEQYRDAHTHYEQKLKDIKTHHDDVFKAEDKAFHDQYEQAQHAYAAQRQQLQESLGKQLTDIAEQQLAITRLYGIEAARRVSIDALASGRDATAAQQGFIQQVNNIQINGNLIHEQDAGEWIAGVLNDRNQRNGGTLTTGGPQ